MSETKIRRGTPRPTLKKYPFERLEERDDSFFLPGADAHRVRQAARSFERHHIEIAEAGDALRVSKEKEDGVEGAGVYRVAKED